MDAREQFITDARLTPVSRVSSSVPFGLFPALVKPGKESETWGRSLGRTKQLREAVLLAFCDPVPGDCARLRSLSAREWKHLLFWLDTSGMALYFLDRMTQLELCEVFPPRVLARLKQNLADNTAKTNAMLTEFNAIQQSFQGAGLSYAVLKGFSLGTLSVPKMELRSQLDIDFLIAEKDAEQAKGILRARGYMLHAVSGRSLEFKAAQDSRHTIKDLYKPTPQCSAELHLATGGASLLQRARKCEIHGACTPVLSPADLFLGQGMHLYKHLCSESYRAAHLIEFRRHVIARFHDHAFWQELRELAKDGPQAAMALGFVTLLISRVMGEFAPQGLTCWTMDCLPGRVRLWVDMYGHQLVFASFPGTKLYLLLQKEMRTASLPAKRSQRQALLPRRWPPMIHHAKPGETWAARIRRYWNQVRFVLLRLRFHVTEDLRYGVESVRWRNCLRRMHG